MLHRVLAGKTQSTQPSEMAIEANTPLTCREIADILHISKSSVYNYLRLYSNSILIYNWISPL